VSKPRRLRWASAPQRPVPEHPYRDTALVYGFFALLIVLLAWVTGGAVLKAAELAGAFFVATVAWGWFRWRQRIAQDAATSDEELL